jgi:hypothetical protein
MFVLDGILKAESQEKILIYLMVKNSGYPKEIADFFKIGVTPLQKQMLKLEEHGVLVSHLVGRSRVFQLNPQYRLMGELKALISGALQAYPQDIKEGLIIQRAKPRRAGKPAIKAFP